MDRHTRRWRRHLAEMSLLAALFMLVLLAGAFAAAETRGGGEEQMLRDFGLLPTAPLEQPPVRVDFRGAPVAVALGVGVERRVVFEQPFRFGLEPSVAGAFDFEIYGRQLLLSVTRPLTTRAKIQLADGRIIPLDIEAVFSAAVTAPLEIVARTERSPADPDEPPAAVPALGLPPAPPGYVDLVRFAAQRLYSPSRLQRAWPGIAGTPVEQAPVRLMRGARIRATPLASWRSGQLVVTAVRLDNLEARRIGLDPRQVLGVWKAAAFHHRSLGEHGASALYLVSDRPFGEALGVHARIAVGELPSGLESWKAR